MLGTLSARQVLGDLPAVVNIITGLRSNGVSA